MNILTNILAAFSMKTTPAQESHSSPLVDSESLSIL